MAEDIVVGMRAFLARTGEIDKFLIAFSFVDFGTAKLLASGRSRPMITEPVAEARRDETVEELRNGIVEETAEMEEHTVGRAEAVAMRKIAGLAIKHHLFGLAVDDDARFTSEPAVGPDIVITDEEMDGTMRRSLAKRSYNGLELSEMTSVRPIVFHPEIKHIAQEIDSRSILLHLLEKRDEALLVRLGICDHERAEVYIANEINHPEGIRKGHVCRPTITQ